MDRAQKLRAVRIAAALGFVLMCCASTILWIRSYRSFDQILGGCAGYCFGAYSLRGELHVVAFDPNAELSDPEDLMEVTPSFTWYIRPAGEWRGRIFDETDGAGALSDLGFGWRFGWTGFHLTFPHWSLATGFAALAAIFTRRWQFSLFTLLVAMTLIAVMLGIGLRQ
jgi:hypothetical protein